MAQPLHIIPEVSGVPVTDFAADNDFTTDAFAVGEGFSVNHIFSFVTLNNSVGGAPKYTLQAQNNLDKWDDYPNAINISLGDGLKGNNIEYLKFRIVYNSLGVSSGTLSMEMTLKHPR